MYTHDLVMSKGQDRFSIPCEDLPAKEKTIGVWLHELEAPKELVRELAQALLSWSKTLDELFHIYESRDKFLANEERPNKAKQAGTP